MELQEAERMRVLRANNWAVGFAEQDLAAGFPILRTLGTPTATAFVEYVEGLETSEQLGIVRAFARVTNNIATDSEYKRVDRARISMKPTLTVIRAERFRRKVQEKPASWNCRRAANLITLRLGDLAPIKPKYDGDGMWLFSKKIGDWEIITRLDQPSMFGSRVVSFCHLARRTDAPNTLIGSLPVCGIPCAVYPGFARWKIVFAEDEEQVADAIGRLGRINLNGIMETIEGLGISD